MAGAVRTTSPRRFFGGAIAFMLTIAATPFGTLSPAHATPSDITVKPNPNYSASPFQGWGTSLAWLANATGGYPDTLRSDLVKKTFGADGLALNIARYNIGGGNATDVGGNYLRPGAAVPGWWNPNLPASDANGAITSAYSDRNRYLSAWNGDQATDYDFSADTNQRWWISQIKDKVTRWEAFSNSPPYFMTESGYVTGGTNSSADQIKSSATSKFAKYLKTVAQHVEHTEGIAFSSIDPLNEPNTNYWGTSWDAQGNFVKGKQEGAHASPALQATVISALAAELAKSDTTTRAIVAAPDETDPSRFVQDWNGWTSAARASVGQLNVHTYSTNGRSSVRDIAKLNAKPLWMSEVEGNWGPDAWNPTTMDNGLGLAQRINDDLRELEPTAWVLWQPIEDFYNMQHVERKNWGAIFVDFDCDASSRSARRVAAGEADPTCKVVTNTKYDTMRNFTHYIRPGDRLIAVDSTSATAAVKADSSGLVVVQTNAETASKTIKIDLSNFATISSDASVTPIVTTESPASTPSSNALVSGTSISVDATSKSAVVTVPARSVTTFVINGVSGIAASAPGLADGGSYRLTGVQSGKSLTAGTPNDSAKTTITSIASPTADLAQRWTATVVNAKSTTGKRFVLSQPDGRFLTASGASTDLKKISLTTAISDPSAQWMPVTTNGSIFSVFNVATGTVLDVGGQRTDHGAPVGVWTSNGGANQQFTIVPAPAPTPPTFPTASLTNLAAHGFTLYFANCGAQTVNKVAAEDNMGLYQSVTDQPYGLDPATKARWGYVIDGTSNPTIGVTTSSVDKTDTLMVDAEPSGARLPAREVKYAFDIPNGTYQISLGFKLGQWWGDREIAVSAEDTPLGQFWISTTASEKTYTVTVTDERLDLSAHSVTSRDNGQLDPAINYITVKTEGTWDIALLKEAISANSSLPGDYTSASRATLQTVIAAGQALVDANSTDTAAIKAAYEKILTARNALATKPHYVTFRPGQEWLDDNAKVIQAHGGQVVTSTDAGGKTIYYLYGEDRTNGYHNSPGVHVYSSYDLYNWTDRGVALRAMASASQFDTDPYFQTLYADYTADQKAAVYRDLGTAKVSDANPPIIERPKVIHNKTTGKWVMWFHADGPYNDWTAQYAKAKAGLAVADSPFGPFKYVDSYRLHHADPANHANHAPTNPGMARDMNLYVDRDGTGYIIYSSEENKTMFVSKLNADYTWLSADPDVAVEGIDFTRVTVGWSRESPAIFEYDGTYYMITSGTTGWSPNPSLYATAPTMLGPWTPHNNPFHSSAAGNSNNSQPTSIIPIDPQAGKYIYMGDRWNGGTDLVNAQMVWLPITLGAGTDLTIETPSEWRLEDITARPVIRVTGVPDRLRLGESLTQTTVEVTSNGVTTTQPVTWQSDTSMPGLVTVTGTLPGMNNRTFTKQLLVLPDGLRYVVNAGGTETADWKAIVAGVPSDTELLNSKAEQPIAADPATGATWGYDSPDSGAEGTASGTMSTTLRWAAGLRDLTYSFGALPAGKYTVYAGYYDPWSRWDYREAKVTINGVVQAGKPTFSETPYLGTYADIEVGTDGRITFTLTPRTNKDIQVSWIMIAAGPSPAMSTSPATPDGSNGWYKTTPTTTLTSIGSPVQYRLNAAQWTTYSAPFTTGDGEWTLEARVGEGPAMSASLKVDTVAPTVHASVSQRTITLDASDAVSGLERIEYRIGSGDWTPYTGPVSVPGTDDTTVTSRASDQAGNTSPEVATPVKHALKPKVTLSSAEVRPGDPVTVTVSGYATGTAQIVLHSDPVSLGTVNVDTQGNGSVIVTIPSDAPLGKHQVEVTQPTDGITLDTYPDAVAPVQLVSATDPRPTITIPNQQNILNRPLPTTGAAAIGIALSAIFGLVGAMFIARKHRSNGDRVGQLPARRVMDE